MRGGAANFEFSVIKKVINKHYWKCLYSSSGMEIPPDFRMYWLLKDFNSSNSESVLCPFHKKLW